MAKCKVVLNCPLWIKQPSHLSVIHFKSLQNVAWTWEQNLKLYWDNCNMRHSSVSSSIVQVQNHFPPSAESWWEWALSWTVGDVGNTSVSMSVLGLRVTAQTKFGCFGLLEVMKCSADCRSIVLFSLRLDVLLPIFTFQDFPASKFPLWSPVRPMLQSACYFQILIKLICLRCDWKPETSHKAAAENR